MAENNRKRPAQCWDRPIKKLIKLIVAHWKGEDNVLGYITFGVFALGCLTVAWWYQVQYHKLRAEHEKLWNVLIEEVGGKSE
jgi:hypothetical protein